MGKRKKDQGADKKIVVGLVALFLVLGVVGVASAAKAQVGDFFGKLLVEVGLTSETLDFLKDVKEDSLGAQPGPDSFHSVECHNGVCKGFVTAPFTASTSPCVLRNPLGATSTIVSWSAAWATVNYGANQTAYLSTSTNSGGTTTKALINEYTLVNATEGDLAWTPHLNASTTGVETQKVYIQDDFLTGENPFTLGANEWLNFSVATGSRGSFSGTFSGSCAAEFQQVGAQ